MDEKELWSNWGEVLGRIERDGEAFTVTREGHPIAEIRPVGRHRRRIPQPRHPRLDAPPHSQPKVTRIDTKITPDV